MIRELRFRNFKVLRNCTLPLGACTVLVGPNGSGKTTVMEALRALRGDGLPPNALSVGADEDGGSVSALDDNGVEVKLEFASKSGKLNYHYTPHTPTADELRRVLQDGIKVFGFDLDQLVQQSVPAPLEIHEHGSNFAGTLDALRDHDRARFDALNDELRRWLPEFKTIHLRSLERGSKVFELEMTEGGHRIPATSLSAGTLYALALLTLAYLPKPPRLVGIEEPDREIHPRLLDHVKDAMYRLAYPEPNGEDRPPVQIIATTHSPYFLDLFRDSLDEIVVAEKSGLNVAFKPVAKQPHVMELIADRPVGEAWFNGSLGGVPAGS